jgi:hypothetical protein
MPARTIIDEQPHKRLGMAHVSMKAALLLLVLSAMTHAQQPRIIFDNRPESGLPREIEVELIGRLRELGKLPKAVPPPAESDRGRPGPLTALFGDTVQTIAVRYFSDKWSGKKQVSDYLSGLLADGRTEAYTYQVWSQGVGEPEIECLLHFKKGEQGRLLLWGNVGCLRDNANRWWFVVFSDYYHGKHPDGTRSLVRKVPKRP